MNKDRIRKIIIIAVALCGVVINSGYGISLLTAFFNPHNETAIKEILISAIALEFGWAALLIWVILKPFERRAILLFTLIPILLGNFLHSVNQIMESRSNGYSVALNSITGLVVAGLFLFAFVVGKPNDSR